VISSFEVNFDGLVGPTHNYSGLSHGNIASTSFKSVESSPLQAVLQGLEKMKSLASEGFKQGLFPPQERPDLHTLRKLGFIGTDKKILEEVSKKSPELLMATTSASSMWTANAATVSPSADTRDRKVHFTPANLITKFHRSIEVETTSNILKKIFKDPKHFVHHEALPSSPAMGDEGAANHTRLCSDYGKKGLEFFVYGRTGLNTLGSQPKKFPARQTLEACETLARTHGLDSDAVVLAQQNPEAIDAGVFHNDVVGVGNQNVYFYHEDAYVETEKVVAELGRKFLKICGSDLEFIKVPTKEVSLDDAVKSYLFNSQLLTTDSGKMTLIAPSECREIPSVARYLENLLGKTTPIHEVRYFNLRQSMQNGGGPACLRLRVVLKAKELGAINQKVLMNEKLYNQLVVWAKKNYREKLNFEDLADPKLVTESRTALDELTKILGLGSIYPFQR
jgi:succinylarginine dihydrolase